MLFFRTKEAELWGPQFEDQFEPDGPDYLFRRNLRGPPIRVSAAECETFLNEFDRARRKIRWTLWAAVALLVFGLSLVEFRNGRDQTDTVIWFCVIPMVVGLLLAHRWSWNAPARTLARRTPEGGERSRKEIRQLLLSKTTYRQLGVAAFLAIGGMFKAAKQWDIAHGWGLVMPAATLLLLLLFATTAFRKWRFDRSRQ